MADFHTAAASIACEEIFKKIMFVNGETIQGTPCLRDYKHDLSLKLNVKFKCLKILTFLIMRPANGALLFFTLKIWLKTH